MLRYVECAKEIRKLLFTIVKSAPALFNIGSLLFLITFIYAIVGMNLFGYVKHNAFINPAVNFETFLSSFCVLFRISTAAGWNGVLLGCAVEEPLCDPKHVPGGSIAKGNCGHKVIASLFFSSYIFINCLIIVNMYIAVILDQFNAAQVQEETGISEDDIESYYEVWKIYDPKATQFISYNKLATFLDELEQPLRVAKPNYWFLAQCTIPIKIGNTVHCLDVLVALMKHTMGCDNEDDDSFLAMRERLEDKYNAVFASRKKMENLITSIELAGMEFRAASRIQRMFRWYIFTNKLTYYVNKNDKNDMQTNRTLIQVRELWKRMSKTRHDLYYDDVRSEIERQKSASSDCPESPDSTVYMNETPF